MILNRRSALALLASSVMSPVLQARAQYKGHIGVALPAGTSPRWAVDGTLLKAALEQREYSVDLQFAENDVARQTAQIESMLSSNLKALVIAPVDGGQLSPVLQKAADAKVKVVSYDRLIRDSWNVDFYVTFDGFRVGALQADSLLKGLGYPEKQGPWNIELFAGSPDHLDAARIYEGAMSVLQPLLEKGVLVVKSGQVAFADVATLRWEGVVAQMRLENILVWKFSDGSRIDALLAPSDHLARAVIGTLRSVGYGTPELPWPIVTGFGAETASVRAIIAGEQYSTIFKDPRELARGTADLLDAMMSEQSPPGLDMQTYHNGLKVVPAMLLAPVIVDRSNYMQMLVDGSGYVKAEEIR